MLTLFCVYHLLVALLSCSASSILHHEKLRFVDAGLNKGGEGKELNASLDSKPPTHPEKPGKDNSSQFFEQENEQGAIKGKPSTNPEKADQDTSSYSFEQENVQGAINGKPPSNPEKADQDMPSHTSDQDHLQGVIKGWHESVNKPLSVMHFIVTRFMQDQGELVQLARARLKQFEVMCLPTILAQSSKQFFWIIRVDPNLDASVREEMVALLQPYPNFYLVPSNMHYFPSHWRSNQIAMKEILKSAIFSGDQKLFQKAWEKQSSLLLLETRLDADDGLKFDFVEEVQNRTFSSLHKESIVHDSWKFFCTNNTLEWRPDESMDAGILREYSFHDMCFASGLTVASSGVQPKGGNHRRMAREKGICRTFDSTECVEIMNSPSKHYLIGTRSATSTSM